MYTPNILSIDIEDYWSIFSRDWLKILEAQPTEAVVKNTKWFLEKLSSFNVKATFFILVEVAVKFPGLVKEIAGDGHEIGLHGLDHRQIFKLSPDEFRRSIKEGKKLLEDLAGVTVSGHRAPAFSITPSTKWALEVLAEEDFEYDSSIFPISGRRYGWPGFSKEICQVVCGSGQRIVEVPLSTLTLAGKTLPVAGGGYLRHFPYWINKAAIKHIQRKRAAIVYMHPYEIEIPDFVPDVSRLDPAAAKKTLKLHGQQLRSRKTMPGKISKLLSDFQFGTISQVIQLSKTSGMPEVSI